MVKRFLAALFALAFANAALAQSFPKPPDVPAYVPVTPNYADGTTPNVLGDGSANGGTPPAYSYELADIPTTESGWTIPGTAQCLTVASGGTCMEAKTRFQISGKVKILHDDPIRNFGQPGAAHCHEFFNNMSANAFSTFASLRNNARKYSLGSGGPLNGTGYWMPCPIKTNPFGDGKNYAVVPTNTTPFTLYYVQSPYDSPKMKRLILGLRYVGGTNMDDPNQQWLVDILNAENNVPATRAAFPSGRYFLCNPGAASQCGTSQLWQCTDPATGITGATHWWKNADGTDPFAGKCPAGADMWMQFVGPACWDGVNLWSPGGYRHVIPYIYDSLGGGKMICPNAWYLIPELTLQIHFRHQGFSDYGNWRLSSDDMMQAKLAALGTPRTVLNGESFHTDWMNGWDKATLDHWLKNCLGLGELGGTPHECNASALGDDLTTISTTAAPTGRSPQVQPGIGDTSTPAGMGLVPTQLNGPTTVHVHRHM